MRIDEAIGQLEFLSSEERQKVLHDWNNTAREFSHVCVHELFERQAEKTPHDVAVILHGREISYQDLNHWANQLAHHLQATGIKREMTAGIYVRSGLGRMVIVLAVLKAG